MLDDLECSDETAEYNRFVERRIDQWPLFEAVAQAERIANHDDFAQEQCFDHREPIVRVSDVMDGENNTSILCECRKYERQINDISPIFDEFMA